MKSRWTIALRVAPLFVILILLGLASVKSAAPDDSGLAATTGPKTADTVADMPKEAKSSPSAGDGQPGAAEVNYRSIDFPRMYAKLQERERDLDRRERELELARQELEALKVEVREKLDELEMARLRIDEAYGKASALQVKRLKGMAPSYEAMRPENAAKLIAGIDTPDALTLLELMDPKKVAKILDALALQEPDKAIQMSRELHHVIPKP